MVVNTFNTVTYIHHANNYFVHVYTDNNIIVKGLMKKYELWCRNYDCMNDEVICMLVRELGENLVIT